MKKIEYFYMVCVVSTIAVFIYGIGHAAAHDEQAHRTAVHTISVSAERIAVEKMYAANVRESANIKARCQAVADSLNAIGQ